MKNLYKIVLPLFFISFFGSGQISFSADFKLPGCSQVEQWAAGFDPNANFNLTPKLEVNNLFSADNIQPLFGTKVLAWEDNQRQEVGPISAAMPQRCQQAWGQKCRRPNL